MQAAAALISEILSTYEKALNTSDTSLAVSLYARDGVFIPPGAPTATGLAELTAAYDRVFAAIQLHVLFGIEEIVVDEKIAFARTTSAGTTLIHDSGQTVKESNRELFVFVLENDAWKIARYMFNQPA